MVRSRAVTEDAEENKSGYEGNGVENFYGRDVGMKRFLETISIIHSLCPMSFQTETSQSKLLSDGPQPPSFSILSSELIG